jgi:hypothetical protein
MKPAKPRETYCRICGPNKGHAFSNCANFRGMRQIILKQDEETRSKIEELTRLRRIENSLTVSEANLMFVNRVLNALLDSYERLRASVKA